MDFLWLFLGGLGLFLFAMGLIEEALEAVSGPAFRRFIRRNTDHPLMGAASGTMATAVLQSSSLVGLMTLALVGAGVIRLRNALGIIFGANLGTTATGWIVATLGFKLDLDAAALPLIGLGGTLAIAVASQRFRAYARIGLGIGLLLLGLSFMKSAVGDVDELIEPEFLAGLSPAGFFLFGIVFSAVVQSSSATMMVTLAALHGGIIDLPSAAAVAIGADLGTTATLLLGAFKGNPAKKRVAAGHFLFNVVTDLLAFALRVPLLAVVAWFALSDLLSLVAFHSLFNLLGVLLFLPLTTRFANLLERLFEDTPHTVNRHLSPEALDVVEAALEAVQLETGHLLARAIRQNRLAFEPPLPVPEQAQPIDGLPEDAAREGAEDAFLDAYERSKRLEGEIFAFTTSLQGKPLTPEQSRSIDRCRQAARDAVHSSKSLKDIQGDLARLRASPDERLHGHLHLFRDAQTEFYGALLQLKPPGRQAIGPEDFARVLRLAGRLHSDLHRRIANAVRDGHIPDQQVSALLNVNRELANSNRSIVQALATFLLEPAEAESLEADDPVVSGPETAP